MRWSPGKPLAFLDAQVKVGNALVGATPMLLDGGLPQEAFKPIEGDDKKTVSALAKRNKQEAGGQGSLFGAEEARTSNAELIEAAAGLVGAGLSLGDIHVQQQRLQAVRRLRRLPRREAARRCLVCCVRVAPHRHRRHLPDHRHVAVDGR